MIIRCLTQHRVIKPETIHPVIMDDGESLVLADCGDPELAYALMEEMRLAGFPPERLTHIIITHHDLDHMGGLSQFRDVLPDVTVMSTAVQAEYISGRARWLRLQEEDKRYLALPPEKRCPTSRVRAAQYLSFLPARVDTLIREDELLPLCGGIRVISTPWHMPGHISLYIPAEKAIITGDALNTFGGRLSLNAQVDLCPELARDGLSALAQLDVEHVFAYHGGELHLEPQAFQAQLADIISGL